MGRNTAPTPTDLEERATLPLDLFFIILEEAQYEDLLPRYKWLKNYSLVCRAWRPRAQQLLFRQVTLNGGSDHCKTFQRAIASAEARDPEHALLLKSAVRTLSMVLDHQEIYADVAAHCPHLRELHVALYHGVFRPAVLRGLAPSLARLRALRVRTYRYATLFQLLALCPALDALEVDCAAVHDPALALPPAPAPPWPLRELRYTNLRRGTHTFVAWALAHAPGELEALRVACPSFEADALPALGVTPGLRAFALPRMRRAADLAPLVCLTELALTDAPGSAAALAALPAGIAHLTLDAMRLGECAPVVAALAIACNRAAEGEGKGLRALTYNRRRADRVGGRADVEMLWAFCEERGIEFRLMDPPYGYHPGEVRASMLARIAVEGSRGAVVVVVTAHPPDADTVLPARGTCVVTAAGARCVGHAVEGEGEEESRAQGGEVRRESTDIIEYVDFRRIARATVALHTTHVGYPEARAMYSQHPRNLFSQGALVLWVTRSLHPITRFAVE